MTKLREFIESKPFVTRKQLKDRNEELRKEAVDDFESTMNSSETRLEDKLYKLLEENYGNIFDENEIRRETALNEMVENICCDYMDVLNKELIDNQFIDSLVLEEKFKTERKKAFDVFHNSIKGEDIKLFDRYQLEVKAFIKSGKKLNLIILFLVNQDNY